MKVAFTLREMKWGIGEHTKNLLKYLGRLGVESEFFVGNTSFGTNKLLLSARLKDFDVIHVQGSPFGFFTIEIPKVTTVHTLLKREIKYDGKLSYLLGQAVEKRTLNTSDKIICVNPLMIRELTNHYGVERSKIRYIPNGLDLEEFDGASLPREGFVLSCGRNIKRKRLADIDVACKLLGLSHVNAGRDRFISRKELLDLYKRASMYVCASEYETGAITVMDAMASKCPVICTNIPELLYYVDDGETALTFTPRNVEELTKKMRFLQDSSNLDLKDKIVKNAEGFVREYFDWKDLARETLSVYNELMK